MDSETKYAVAKAIQTTRRALIIVTDRESIAIPWERCSERLARATDAERSVAVLSPSGYGIHWPLLDEDLAVDPLLRLAA